MTVVRPTVFIGSSAEGLEIAKALQVNLDHACQVVVWSQGIFGLGGGTLDSLVVALDTYDFAVLVLTPDDMTTSRDITQPSPRDNVLLELGMFIGGIGQKRTFIVYERTADIKLPTDLAGVTPASYQCHQDGNLISSLGAATTLIQNAINAAGRRHRTQDNEVIRKDTHFQIINGLLDDASEQYIILMHERDIKLRRRTNVFDPRNLYEYHKEDSSGRGGFSVDDLCRKLADADILSPDLRDQISLTDRGHEFAVWLIDRGHKAAFFTSELGSWGQPLDRATKLMGTATQPDKPLPNGE